ncbi:MULTISPECIES: radical SAM family heme chaperone HemW [Synechococcales]|uniref:radical SAM family heme chaperone HemW n=1 Tax=Synechococcus sp. CS-1333 TaxID=2848638 RepID=UPI00223AAC0B|nr:radical SAM family heme chaperone HemW [Synechococcus sp. CS-1333]MCT0209826.1 radical SAM family heme chaperone HemW [Synechococcus sp. CS-1333]
MDIPTTGESRGPRSAYVHIPFCQRRCFYCDFAVVPLGDRADGASSGSIQAYLKLLLSEIAASPAGPPLSTVYLGGGTPSLLTAGQIRTVLEALKQRYGIAAGAEITLEMDPASFDRPRLAGVLAAGVNRVSLGGQSFDDGVLERLGRRHRRRDLLEAASWLQQARQLGDLRSWSLDLIQGLPQQDLAHWRGQLDQALALSPPHLSIYDLIVEPGTVFARRQQQGQLELPEPDLGADLMDLTGERLRAAGYGHYEISNYATPGHASRHNRVYWSGAGWWGFGMGATSAPYGLRLARPRTRAAYAAWLTEGMEQATAMDQPAVEPSGGGMAFDELMIVGLRRREGVAMAELARRHGLSNADLEDLLAQLSGAHCRELLRIEGGRWRLSDPAGLALSNAVLRVMVEWWEQRASSLPSIGAGPEPPAGAHRSVAD